MPETFLILLTGGVMLAAAISDPHQVTLHWLRLCGIIALSLAFFRDMLRRAEGQGSPEVDEFIALRDETLRGFRLRSRKTV